jgi:hypothetical protein
MVWEIHLNLKDQLFPLERRKADELWDKHIRRIPAKNRINSTTGIAIINTPMSLCGA